MCVSDCGVCVCVFFSPLLSSHTNTHKDNKNQLYHHQSYIPCWKRGGERWKRGKRREDAVSNPDQAKEKGKAGKV